MGESLALIHRHFRFGIIAAEIVEALPWRADSQAKEASRRLLANAFGVAQFSELLKKTCNAYHNRAIAA